MRLTMTPTAASTKSRPSGIADQPAFWRLVGIAIASLVPAVFWTSLIELVSLWLGAPISPLKIAIVGFGIAAFLAAVCAPLVLRKSATEFKSH
jgi:hypothetical protein